MRIPIVLAIGMASSAAGLITWELTHNGQLTFAVGAFVAGVLVFITEITNG